MKINQKEKFENDRIEARKREIDIEMGRRIERLTERETERDGERKRERLRERGREITRKKRKSRITTHDAVRAKEKK